ncbi:tRNA (adenosine(37)-N6)-threonylcarbamoyltransferase complex dimerization subunit type 1 TsaB [Candidatus Saccharibacteria bacterium]|nr:tRNA (adenosine(37)-N6)-threonylcarbamoyltransferase complex dimerization subunit type 1 TsaB [Candidatus Saccharibacteria bacterium]
MILALRTDKPEAELYILDAKRVIKKVQWQAHRELADTLLTQITKLVGATKITLNDLSGIIIYTGSGSFTGLRIGATVANTLAYSLNIPICSGQGNSWLQDGRIALKNAKTGEFIVPQYDSEPNITQPKSPSA